MKYLLPFILFLSGCTNRQHEAAQVQACSEAEPIVSIAPKRNDEKQYRDNYFHFSFDIAISGKVENLQLKDSDSDEFMKKQTLRAFSKWLFKPKILDRRPYKQTNCEFKYVYSSIDWN